MGDWHCPRHVQTDANQHATSAGRNLGCRRIRAELRILLAVRLLAKRGAELSPNPTFSKSPVALAYLIGASYPGSPEFMPIKCEGFTNHFGVITTAN